MTTESVKIYSSEALELLQQALHLLEASSSTTGDVVRMAAIVSESSASEDEEDKQWLSNEQSSSSSDDGSDVDVSDKEDGQIPIEKDSSVLSDKTKGESMDTKKASKYTVKKQQKRAQIENTYIIKQSAMMPRTRFPLNQELVLELPSAFLSKQVQMDLVSQCRSYITIVAELATKPVVLLLLKSGRFAGVVFQGDKCLAHKAHQRYTIRAKQGRAQSSLDSSKQKAKSMGAQLRRAGELSLREDVASTLDEWKQYIESASLILLSCPPTMKKGLFSSGGLNRKDARLRRIPLDAGRPTYEAVCAVYDILMQGSVRPAEEKQSDNTESEETKDRLDRQKVENRQEQPEKPKAEIEITPLGSLHTAAAKGDVTTLKEMLNSQPNANEKEIDKDSIHVRAGPDFMTSLHFAAASTNKTDTSDAVDPSVAAECVSLLLEKFGANPCLVDARNRPPYFLASNEKVRNAFRTARANLGEEAWLWDKGAKVGPPLDQESLQQRQAKVAEKKRRQRARQKERKAKERAEKEKAKQLKKQQEEERKQQEDAKRIRDGLKPKPPGQNICDYCQKPVKGKRSQMFHRLDYSYCSSECVLQHKRELIAAAAMARLGE